jgi:hypothetical protein
MEMREDNEIDITNCAAEYVLNVAEEQMDISLRARIDDNEVLFVHQIRIRY